MEEVTVILTRKNFDFLIDNNLLKDYSIKEIYVKDEMFKEDQSHWELVKNIAKAKDKLKEYEFKKRNKIT